MVSAILERWYDFVRFLQSGAPYIVEGIGTFFLSLSVGLNVTQDTTLPPLAIGFTLMFLIYMGGHISGGHYNPSVTLGVYLRGNKITLKTALFYLVSQILGGLFGALLCWFITRRASFSPTPTRDYPIGSVILSEFFYTFALVFVVLQTTTTKSQANNPMYGFAIGAVVAAGVSSVGGISGAGFNPAVATGAHLVDVLDPATGFLNPTQDFKYLWVYWMGPLLGSLLAALTFRLTNPHDCSEELQVLTDDS